MRASYDGVQIETIGGFGLLLEIVGIVLWRSFDVFGRFARETRAGFHAPAERLDEAAIALPAAGLGRGERGVGQGRCGRQPEANEQSQRLIGDEIGRAPRRERVCQDVSISVGAVTVKKKKT